MHQQNRFFRNFYKFRLYHRNCSISLYPYVKLIRIKFWGIDVKNKIVEVPLNWNRIFLLNSFWQNQKKNLFHKPTFSKCVSLNPSVDESSTMNVREKQMNRIFNSRYTEYMRWKLQSDLRKMKIKLIFFCLSITSVYCYSGKVPPKQKKLSRKKRFFSFGIETDPGKNKTN